MFVGFGFFSTSSPPSERMEARSAAFRWSSARRLTLFSRAYRPAAAIIPDCLRPPPTFFLQCRAFAMKSAEPQSMLPTGAPSPFDKQNCTVSTWDVNSVTGQSHAAAALNTRAPSMWTERPCLRAMSVAAFIWPGDTASPPHRLWVFSTQRSFAGAK